MKTHKNTNRNDSVPYRKETVDLVLSNLSLGLKRTECFIGIIAESTFFKWLKERPEFLEAVRIAEFKCKRRALFLLHRSMEKDARWSAWWLERKCSDEFAPRQKFEHTGARGGPIRAVGGPNLTGVTEKQLTEFISAVDRASKIATPDE